VIIIEGPDNSGKSTLARHCASRISVMIQESEGPPKWAGEITERIRRYKGSSSIFVRHPAVSNPIYDMTRPVEEQDIIPIPVITEFYDQSNLFVYCDPGTRGFKEHQIKQGIDTDIHLRRIVDNHGLIVHLYRTWAALHAHVVYRIGDDMDFVADIVSRRWEELYGHRRLR
jgi:hypothetical protein